MSLLESAVRAVGLYGWKARIICSQREHRYLSQIAARRWPKVKVEFIVRW